MKPLTAAISVPKGVLKDGEGGGKAVHRSQGRGMSEGQEHTYFKYTLFHNTNHRSKSLTNLHPRASPPQPG